MAQPSIRIDQATPGVGTAGQTRVDLILGETILFADEANVAGTVWTLRGRPVGSAAALTPSGNNVTLVPDLEGMYIVEAVNGPDSSGVVNDIDEFDSEQGGAGIKLPNGILIPAANEKHQQGSEHGWATSMDFALRQLDTLIGGGVGASTLDDAYDGAGSGAGRTITADSNAVVMTSSAADNNNVLEIVKTPAASQTGYGLSIQANNNHDDYAIGISSRFGIQINQATQTAASALPTMVVWDGAPHTGVDNTTAQEIRFNLGRTITFQGGGSSFIYTGIQVLGPTLAASAVQNIAPTTMTVTAPSPGANVTLNEPWAIAGGQMAIGRTDIASGDTQAPGLRIERIPTTPLSPGDRINSPHLSLIGIDDFDGTDTFHGFAWQTQPDASPGARFALLYSTGTGLSLPSESGWDPANPIFSIEHTGDVVMTGPASVTLNSATDGLTIAQSGAGHGLTFNSDTTPTRADMQFTLATANPTTLEEGTLWYVAGATNLLRYYDGTSVIDIGSGGGGEANLGANVGVGTGLIFRDKTSATLNFKSLVEGAGIALTNGADDITIAANMTMDETYDNGSTITVDAGAVVLDADSADATYAMEITREPAASAARGLRVLMGANTTGAGIVVEQNGTGLAADFNGDVDISGKLTVGGLIDPTGLVLVNQASVPGGTPASGSTTLWVDSTSKNLMLTDDAGTDFDLQAANGVYVLQTEFTLTGVDDDTDIELGAAGFDGDVIGIVVRSDDARTAGDVTFNAQVAGVTTLSATLDGTNTQVHAVTENPGVHSFTQGQRLSINVVEGTAFTPNTTVRIQVHLTNNTVTTSAGTTATWTPISTIEIDTGADRSTMTWPDTLDIDTDKAYRIDFCIKNSAAATRRLNIIPNNISANQRSTGKSGSTGSFGNLSEPRMMISSVTREFIIGWVELFKMSSTDETYFRASVSNSDAGSAGADHAHQLFSGVWNDTANITGLELEFTDTSFVLQAEMVAGSWATLSKIDRGTVNLVTS